MNEKDRIETARKILNNAFSLNLSKDILLKISRLIDKYVVDYHKKRKQGGESEKNEVTTAGDRGCLR